MLLLKLSDTQGRIFDESPEADMGLHFAQVEDKLGFVLSGRVLMLPATKRHEGQEQSDALAKELWFGPEVRKHGRETVALPSVEMTEAEIEAEESLIQSLHDAPRNVTYVGPTDPFVMGFILNPISYLPPAPRRPGYIYGHLPFTGVTQAGDVFYRCEHWATSRRVLRGTNDVLAGTYGFPASELISCQPALLPWVAMRCPICLRRAAVRNHAANGLHASMRRLHSAVWSGRRRRRSDVSQEI